MWRIAAIALAGVTGAAVLMIGQAQMRLSVAETELAAVGAGVVEEQRMRVCVGPARVTLGGQPFARLAFGGEGCSRNVANLVGFRILKTQAATNAMLSFAQPF
jgi:hypothetical protein